MKRVKFLSLALTMTFLISLVAVSNAQPFPSPKGHPFGKRLNLTTEQQQEIAQLRLEFQKKNLPLRAKLVELRSELKLLLVSDNYSAAKAEGLLDKINKIRKQIALNRMTLQRKIRELLTPEQQQKFDMHILSRKKRASRNPDFHSGAMPGPHSKMKPRMR